MDMEQAGKKGTHDVRSFHARLVEPAQRKQFDEQDFVGREDPSKTNSTRKSTDARQIQWMDSSSPKQRRTGEAGGSGPREFVNIKTPTKTTPKSSPASLRRQSSQDYITMAPVTLSVNEQPSYVNFSPGDVMSETESPSYINICPGNSFGSSANDSVPERSYVNFDPSEFVENASFYQNSGQSYVNFIPGKSMEDGDPLADGNESRTYVNFSPGEMLNNDVRKLNLKNSELQSPRRAEYMNLDLSGNLPDLVESTSVVSADAAVCSDETQEYMNFHPGRQSVKMTTWSALRYGGSPRGKRRESEPVNMYNKTLEDCYFDDNEAPLNYVTLDLGNDSPKGSPKRQRPPNINLDGCSATSLGPKSAPPYKSYVEIDFTKSQGLRQARLESRENLS